MNDENGRVSAVDSLLEQFSRVSVPEEVELRLEARVKEFCGQPEAANVALATAPVIDRRERNSWRRPGRYLAPRRKRLMLSVVLVSLAALAAYFALVSSSGSRDAWGQVAKSVRARPWVRWTLQIPQGAPVPEGFEPPETWFSAGNKVTARRFMKSAQFVDLAHQEVFAYDSAKNVVERTSAGDNDNIEFAHFETLLRIIVEGDPQLASPESPIEIVDRTSREVHEGGRQWKEFGFQCRDSRRTLDEYQVTFRVDPRSQLPFEMRSTQKFGPTDPSDSRTYVIDYPESGPVDIYALGVPRDATVVDRRHNRPANAKEIRELLAAYDKARREPIEPYSTTILLSGDNGKFSDIIRAFRGRHDGNNLYVEEADARQLLEVRNMIWSKQLTIPDGVDRATWWKREIPRLTFAPMPRGDELLPHITGYPMITAGMSPLDDPDCQVTLDRNPTSGPDGTILLRLRIDRKTAFNDMFYWIAPERDYLVLRSETHYSRNHAAWDNVTQIIDDVKQSPGGRWYATKVRVGRIEKRGDDLPTEPVRVTGDQPRTGMEVGPVTTSVFQYFVDFK